MFLDKAFATTNFAAQAKVASVGGTYITGSTCDKASTAVPECFVFENWRSGWVGAYMQEAIGSLGAKVVTMTRANWSVGVSSNYTGGHAPSHAAHLTASCSRACHAPLTIVC